MGQISILALPWPLPERPAMVMATPSKLVCSVSNQKTRSNMSALSATFCRCLDSLKLSPVVLIVYTAVYNDFIIKCTRCYSAHFISSGRVLKWRLSCESGQEWWLWLVALQGSGVAAINWLMAVCNLFFTLLPTALQLRPLKFQK